MSIHIIYMTQIQYLHGIYGGTYEFGTYFFYIKHIPNESIYYKEYEYAIIFGVTPLRGKLQRKNDCSAWA